MTSTRIPNSGAAGGNSRDAATHTTPVTASAPSWQPYRPPPHLTVTSAGDAVPGGYNGHYVAWEAATGTKMGYLDYQSCPDVVLIAMVEVAPEFRRQGVATTLLNALRHDFGDTEIDPGMTTPDGHAWWNHAGPRTVDR